MKKQMKLLIFILNILVVISAIMYLTSLRSTEIARFALFEDITEGDFFVVKNETVIKSPSSGVLKSVVEEGQRVKKGTHVADVLTGVVDEEAKDELVEVTKRIKNIQESKKTTDIFWYDEIKINELISENALTLSRYIAEGDLKNVENTKAEIDLLIKKRGDIKGQDASSQTLEALLAKKNQLEERLGKSQIPIYAPISGVYSSKVDNLENILTPQSLDAITPDDLSNLYVRDNENVVTAQGAACKIVDNFTWYLISTVPKDEIKDYKEGKTIYLRFSDYAEDVNAKVLFIKEFENEGILAIQCDREVPGIFSDRIRKLKIVKGKYEGLRVNKNAVRIVDGVPGVYVLSEGKEKFKKIEVLYENDGYLIVKEDINDKNSLKRYDEVIVSDIPKLN